jgi:hypothetical protein
MERSPFLTRLMLVACGIVALPACSDQASTRALIGKWEDASMNDASIAFHDDGRTIVTGDASEQRIEGTFEFLDETNIALRLNLDDAGWLPSWLPPHVKENQHVRAYVHPHGNHLTMRFRFEIKAGNVSEYIETREVEFTREIDD